MANKNRMKQMAMSMYNDMIKRETDAIIGDALNATLNENIQLKNTIEQIKLQTEKEKTITQGRTQPVDLTERRSGKRRGGTIK
jgi:hypothetical protein